MTIHHLYFVFAHDLAFNHSVFIGVVETLVIGADDGHEVLGGLRRREGAAQHSPLLPGHDCFGVKGAELAGMMGF